MPTTHSPGVRKAAWKTSLDKSNHYFFPVDTLGKIQGCLEKWISIHRDKYPCIGIHELDKPLIYKHKCTDPLYQKLPFWRFYLLFYIQCLFFLFSTKEDKVIILSRVTKLGENSSYNVIMHRQFWPLLFAQLFDFTHVKVIVRWPGELHRIYGLNWKGSWSKLKGVRLSKRWSSYLLSWREQGSSLVRGPRAV